MAARGLTVGTSGNVSMRIRASEYVSELMAITPSGLEYGSLEGEDILVTDLEVEPVDGEGIPSSESLLHAEIYGGGETWGQ